MNLGYIHTPCSHYGNTELTICEPQRMCALFSVYLCFPYYTHPIQFISSSLLTFLPFLPSWAPTRFLFHLNFFRLSSCFSFRLQLFSFWFSVCISPHLSSANSLCVLSWQLIMLTRWTSLCFSDWFINKYNGIWFILTSSSTEINVQM